MRSVFPILSIAGSDSSGGAGIQADVKTISAIGCYAMTAITAITAQNTTGVCAIQGISPDIVKSQIEMIWSDIPPMAVKTGMLYDKDIVEVVANAFEYYSPAYSVVDPVMVSTSGSLLISQEAIDAMVSRIFPLAYIVTPNIAEALKLTGETSPLLQAKCLRSMGCRNILLKGGDSKMTGTKIDYLILEGTDELIELRADTVRTINSHGTGCTLSSAIASYLALGYSTKDAVMRGKLFVTKALENASFIKIGAGHGPLNHLFSPRRMKFRKYFGNQ